MADYKKLKIEAGSGGWGGPVYIEPTAEKPIICAMTGMSVHKVAKYIAELSGGEIADAFRKPAPEEKWCCVVTDCGGTGRCSFYAADGIPTICINPLSPSGIRADAMTPDLVVTGVNKTKYVTVAED